MARHVVYGILEKETKTPMNALEPVSCPAILLAEDDPDQSDMLREALEDEGYKVETAFSGDVALHKLDRNAYQLMILDIRLPGVDGAEVLRRLRSDQSKAHLPVIIVSAFATRDDLQQYKTDGASASFSKPYDLCDLLAMIDRLVRAPGK